MTDPTPAILPEALAAFEAIQNLARRHETADPDLLPAFMTAATAATEGLAALDSLPLPPQRPAVAAPAQPASPAEAADAIAGLAAELAARLQQFAAAADGQGKAVCELAARAARHIRDVMAARR